MYPDRCSVHRCGDIPGTPIRNGPGAGPQGARPVHRHCCMARPPQQVQAHTRLLVLKLGLGGAVGRGRIGCVGRACNRAARCIELEQQADVVTRGIRAVSSTDAVESLQPCAWAGGRGGLGEAHVEVHVCAAGDVVMPLRDALRQLLGGAAGRAHRIFRSRARFLGPCHALQSVREGGGQTCGNAQYTFEIKCELRECFSSV